ncbi:WD repeat-containing protein 63 isoform X2 [Notolabrus celidotus]|uniref:WD repeat-containing protein 63 isoform X2 n=1 Tax=Notolabrus celidotus TaxID=1203425 RepID=UPI0014901B60|nr:WD repeat-containing protein 63 isoform X2 [Notolabrus celidotus]
MPPKRPKSAKSSASSKGKGKKDESPAQEETPDHPDDIYPMVLTSATQGLFGCRADEDVTGDSPYKLLRIDDIVQDIKTRAAVSDFSPVKQTVLDYPEEEILLVFDRDFTYGQSFYLVLTPEAKDRILIPPETESPEEIENDIIKTPEPRLWISHGSEQEIEKESIKETQEKLCLKFSRVRRRFGALVCFSDRSSADAKDGFLQCPSYKDSRFSIKQMQSDCGMQAVPRLQSSSTQTQWKVQRNISTQYVPREQNDEDRERILQSKSLKNFINSVTHRVLHVLQQAEITNVFIDDWKALRLTAEEEDWYGHVPEGLMLFRSLSNQVYSKDKKISSMNWHPTIHGVIAVALTDIKAEQLNESSTFTVRPSFILFYSFTDPSSPQLLLECPDAIFAFEFSPSDPNIIVGGSVNGQVVLWDISAYVTHLHGAQPGGKMSSVNTDTFELGDSKEKTPVVCYCAVSSTESSHKAPITDVQWLPPTFEVTRTGLAVENKNNISVQVVTCSPDGAIMFWDVRVSKLSSLTTSGKKLEKTQSTPTTVPLTFKHLDRTWKPLFRISLPKINTSRGYDPLKFSLEHYTCNDDNTGGTTDKDHENDDSSEVIPDYRQLRVPSAKTLTALEDVNTRLYVGTEDGEIVYTDWKQDKEDPGRLYCAMSFHHCFVNTVQRSPFFKDIIMTVGLQNLAIWKEGVTDGPIIQSQSSETMYTVGCWSLSRPAVFFTGKEDGSVEVWNLLEKASEPVQVYAHVTKARITSIKPSSTTINKQHFLAVSDDLAEVHILRIPKTLCNPSRKEILNLRKFFELEEQKLKDFLDVMELWAKEKKEADDLEKRRQPDKREKTLEERDEDYMKKNKEYLLLEENFQKRLGLLASY